MSWGGVPLNTRTAAMMDEAQALYGATITATQGSPNVGVGASAGTHDGEGVIDVTGADLDAIVYAMREVGFAAWHRSRAEGFTPHVHGVAVGEPGLSSAAADQVTDYLEGRNGLATNAPDDGPRDWVGQTWEGYLAGDPAPGGTRVFRGAQMEPFDVVVTAGSLNASDVYNGISGRADANTITLTAGDQFVLYVREADTSATDIYSLLNWRLNASGHGTIALADSYDVGYSYTPPFTWATLGNVVVNSDTLALTATPASPSLADPAKLDGVAGAVILRVTCTTGTVTLDWACLQVEPPAGLLIQDGSHWSPWFTPAYIPHTPPSTTANQRHIHVEEYGTWTTEPDKQDAVNIAVANAATDYSTTGDTPGTPVSVTPTEGAHSIIAGARLQVQETLIALPDDMAVIVQLDRDDEEADWGTFPDYRRQPYEIDPLIIAGEIALDPGTHAALYEFADGDTTSVRWRPTTITFEYHGDEQNDGATGTVNSLATLGQSAPDLGTSVVWSPTAGVDANLQILCDYFLGSVTFGAPYTTGGDTSWTESDEVIGRLWVASASMAIDLQMPDYRYLVNDWIRSPDALDTTDPEGVVRYLRNRQRNDGLGGWSTPRSKGTSSRQLSLHNRGYE